MPYPESVDDPRPDVRPPTFYKGQWFGPVPRTRIYVRVSSADSPYGFLVDGVVLQADFFPTDPQPPGNGIWFGTLLQDDIVYSLTYESEVGESTSGIGFGQFSVAQSVPPGGVALWRATGFDWRPGENKTLSLFLNQLGVSVGVTAAATWIPDWARPSEKWPEAVMTTPL